jgi:WS/DGAT/MGAT family acyltransferase
VAPPDHEWLPDSIPSVPRLVADSVTSLLGRQRYVPAALGHSASGMVSMARTWLGQRVSGSAPPLTGPSTSFNGSLTSRRSVCLTKVDLDTVLGIRRAFGTTVNDVVLAASGTALRDYLLARGELPRSDLVAAVPVSAHREVHDSEVANQVSNMMVNLPLHPDDPGERLTAVHANTTDSKALQSAFGPDSLQELTSFTLPPVMTAAARLYSGLGLARLHPPVLNLVISNVPGPPVDLYCAGARVTGIFPMGPVMEGSGVNITVLSEARHLNVGIMACPDLLEDVDELGRGFVSAVEELADLAARR